MVQSAIEFHVIPYQKHTHSWFDAEPQCREVSMPTLFWFVEKYHGSPCTLTATVALLLPIVLVGMKEIVVRFKLLPD
jgi:hypothetical protein